jgi:hypothetical protein
MLYDLQHRDLSQFDPRNFPHTGALFDQKKLGFDEITSWWFERLCLGSIEERDTEWTGIITRTNIRGVIEKRITSQYEKRALETKIGQTLKKLCPKMKAERRTIADDTVSGARRQWVHIFPSLKICRAAFRNALRMKPGGINWATGEASVEDGHD